MLTVFLAGGHSKRFGEAGWAKHKVLLPMPDGKTMLEWAFRSLTTQEVFFVGLSSHNRSVFPALMRAALQGKSVMEVKQYWSKTDFKGPLDTLWGVRSFLDEDREILVSYCDIITKPGVIKEFTDTMRASEYDAAVVGTDYPGDRMTRIPGTDLADSGLYWFRSGKQLIKIANKERRGPEDGIPRAVHTHKKWGYWETDGIIDLGVPEDYFAWMATQNCIVSRRTWKTKNQPT